MKRLHVHVAVDDIEQAVPFYRALFGEPPQIVRPDYAKWMLEDPRVNFAISARGRQAGLDHLGIQVDDDTELADVSRALSDTGAPIVEEEAVTCCYARGNKTWVADPAGLLWETFHTVDTATVYGQTDPEARALARSSDSCCTPSA
jgi:catechol 2,3-dioxygenase-like lactoylglutathione lyase family enzyme